MALDIRGVWCPRGHLVSVASQAAVEGTGMDSSDDAYSTDYIYYICAYSTDLGKQGSPWMEDSPAETPFSPSSWPGWLRSTEGQALVTPGPPESINLSDSPNHWAPSCLCLHEQ